MNSIWGRGGGGGRREKKKNGLLIDKCVKPQAYIAQHHCQKGGKKLETAVEISVSQMAGALAPEPLPRNLNQPESTAVVEWLTSPHLYLPSLLLRASSLRPALLSFSETQTPINMQKRLWEKATLIFFFQRTLVSAIHLEFHHKILFFFLSFKTEFSSLSHLIPDSANCLRVKGNFLFLFLFHTLLVDPNSPLTFPFTCRLPAAARGPSHAECTTDHAGVVSDSRTASGDDTNKSEGI